MEMLTMAQIYDIRKLYFEEGKNISQISRETGYDRKTIREYINKNDWNKPVPAVKTNMEFSKLDPYKSIITQWLENDKKAKKKQRHTATRVYNRLKEEIEGFDCSYRTVAAFVTLKKKEIFHTEKEGYLPLEHPAGEAQVDFGDAQFYENGVLHDGKYLNVSFPYSNQGYLQLFYGENIECLLEGLKAIFEYIGGVPTRLWFDNTKTIVTKILKEGSRNLTEKFMRFREHYGFDTVFCNPEAGHEKGNVESKVGYHRRNMLVPIPRFQELRKYNEELLVKCNEDGNREHYRKADFISKLFEEDKKNFLPLPATEFDTAGYHIVHTNGYGRFYLNNGLHEYSVSPKYANTRVVIKITSLYVIPMDENQNEIVRHKRLYGDHKQQSMKWLPYLRQLAKRPGALKYSGIYNIMPEDMKKYLDKCKRSERGKILSVIASLTEKNGFENAAQTVTQVLCYDAVDVDSLISMHRHLCSEIRELPPMKTESRIPRLKPTKTDLSKYDKALKKWGKRTC
jgi:transposase